MLANLFRGDLRALALQAPIVGSSVTPSGRGYYIVATDGGIFAFGDARFAGSMGGRPLRRPVVAMASNATGGGYWLAASDGGVFAFHAPFRGSLGSVALRRPIVAVTRYGNAYLMPHQTAASSTSRRGRSSVRSTRRQRCRSRG